MTFNPKAYVLRSDQVVQKHEERKAWREENKHLAIPFFVKGLRHYVPPVYPGELFLCGAASGEGKTVILSEWHRQMQKALEDSRRRAVTAFISQEETTERLISDDIDREGSSAISSKQTLWIGATWGMKAEDIEDMHMTNIVESLHWGQDSFGDKMPLAGIFYDYVQSTPADPNRRAQMTEELRRLQVKDDTRRLFDAAKTFTCPVIAAAQTMLKKLNAPFNNQMLIPSQRDFEEGAGLFQVPDYVGSFWLARNTHAVGKTVEIDNWKFKVESNLVFFWFLKARGHRPDTAPGISRVFPLRIQSDGEYLYEPEYHQSLLVAGYKNV